MILEDVKHFDMKKQPIRQKHYLRPITWLLSYPAMLKHRVKIHRVNTAGLKPPYLLLCNHNACLDFKVMTAAIFPHRANYVVAMDAFIGMEWLLRNVGGICKRKFTNDITLVRHLARVVKNGDIAVLFPEARYSLCGTTAVLPDSLGKLVKLLKVPVATLIMNGHHVNSPFWDIGNRKVKKIEARFATLLSAEEVGELSPEAINERVREAFVYDDFAWQRDNKIRIDNENRANCLHKILYQCPECGAEYRMNSGGTALWCEACGARWQMSVYGELAGENGETRFSHIPDWYEWERENVRREVREGRYCLDVPARVRALPNSKGFIPLGEGRLVHNLDGFRLSGEYKGEPYVVERTAKSIYSCHIEINYLKKHGDAIDLNTLTDTYYIHPYGCDFSVTKVAIATEEIFEFVHEQAEGMEALPNM